MTADNESLAGRKEEPKQRPIRSFVLRQGRLTPAQRRAYDNLFASYGVGYHGSPLDFAQTFGRAAPTLLEIGFGMGETTVAIAAAQPEHNFLAVDVHTPGVGSLLKQMAEQRLTNLRVVHHDAVEVIRDMVPPNSLDGVHVFFPDPWPKKRHHKRRLLQPPFVELLVSRLRAGAYLHAATDWHDYALYILETFSNVPGLTNTATDFSPRPGYRPQTKFERRGERLGHDVWDIIFKRSL